MASSSLSLMLIGIVVSELWKFADISPYTLKSSRLSSSERMYGAGVNVDLDLLRWEA